jgi:hypothetical protein
MEQVLQAKRIERQKHESMFAPARRHLDLDSTQCYIFGVTDAEQTTRAFKTAWFARAARKARIKDDELCEAIQEVMKGQADDLGGGVFKKRLNKNMHRSIILAKGGRYWIYEYLFAKKDRANIEHNELEDFRTLAKGYATLKEEQITRLLDNKDLTEICHGDEK